MSNGVEIKRAGFVISVQLDGASITTQSVEAHLLYAILEQLKDLNSNVIDVETAVEKAAR